MYSEEYRLAFEKLAHRMRFDLHISPEEAVSLWRELIEEIKEVEVDGVGAQCELDNDLDIVREPIETFLRADDLLTFSEHKYFMDQISTLDESYKENTVYNPKWDKPELQFRWWGSRMLKGLKRFI